MKNLSTIKNKRWFVSGIKRQGIKRLLLCLTGCTGLLLFNQCTKNDPKANFSASSYKSVVGDTIIFTNLSSNATSYIWLFGDNSSSQSFNAKHAYTLAGNYTVQLYSLGTNLSSFTTKTITIQGTITITEGQGIKEVSLSDIWYTIKQNFTGQDSVMRSDTSGQFWDHTVYYVKSGIIVSFFNSSASVIDSSEKPDEISVIPPYSGYTTKGITIGDNIKTVLTTYGTPGTYIDPSRDTLYYYDNLGVQFWTPGTATADAKISDVFEIDVYLPASSQSRAARIEKLKMQPLRYLILRKN